MNATHVEEVSVPAGHPSDREKFVVLHAALGKFSRGDVIRGSDLPPREINRHLAIGSMRLAYPAEAVLEKVEMPDEAKEVSFDQRLAEKDQQIMALREEIRHAQDERQKVNPANESVLAAERLSNAALLREKDRIFSDLSERYKALSVRNSAAEDRLRHAEHKVHELESKLALMEAGSRAPTQEELRARIEVLTDPETSRKSAVRPGKQAGVDGK